MLRILKGITVGRSVSILSATFRKPSYLGLTAVLTASLSYSLYLLSLRSAGVHTTIVTTTESSVGFWLKQFGPGYVAGTLSLDIINGLLISMMIVLTVSSRAMARAGGTCSTASVLLGVATAGCPTVWSLWQEHSASCSSRGLFHSSAWSSKYSRSQYYW